MRKNEYEIILREVGTDEYRKVLITQEDIARHVSPEAGNGDYHDGYNFFFVPPSAVHNIVIDSVAVAEMKGFMFDYKIEAHQDTEYKDAFAFPSGRMRVYYEIDGTEPEDYNIGRICGKVV